MRVLFLNPCGQLGGAEASLRELMASLRSAEPRWKLDLVLGEDGPLAEIARGLGVNVRVLPFPAVLARMGDASGSPLSKVKSLIQGFAGTLVYGRKLRAVCRETAPDLIHTNGFKMHVLGSWARERDTALVWHIHDYVSSRPLMKRLLRLSRRRCDFVIANSKSVAADIREQLTGIPVTPVYNAIDLERFRPSGAKLDLDGLSGLKPAVEGTVRVGLVGTFARWKGHKVFLQALSKLSPDVAARGYVIGAPIYQTSGSQWSLEELRQEARRLGIQDRVGFTGFVKDTPAAMRSLDIVVHASTQPEPFGMVIIEAMACARTVIVSNSGGAAELFEEGWTALGHPAGDASALARQIEWAARQEALRLALGQRARATVARCFHRDRMASEVAAVYRECHRKARRASALQPSFNS